jgi:transposase
MQIAVIGLDLAKNVFQVHGIDDSGQAAVKRKLRRSEVLPFFAELDAALVGIEACHTAHYWGREIAALGHDVRLMPPQFVKPYVKSQKNDAADAEAIAEAVQRPTMRFVPIKSADQQAVLMLHRTRDLLIRQRSSLISAIRAHFAEFGIVVGQGIRNVERLCARIFRSHAALTTSPLVANAANLLMLNSIRDAFFSLPRSRKSVLAFRTLLRISAIVRSRRLPRPWGLGQTPFLNCACFGGFP